MVLLLMAGLKITEEIYLFFGPGLGTMKKTQSPPIDSLFFQFHDVCINSCSQQILDVFSFAHKTTFTALTNSITGQVAFNSLVHG